MAMAHHCSTPVRLVVEHETATVKLLCYIVKMNEDDRSSCSVLGVPNNPNPKTENSHRCD